MKLTLAALGVGISTLTSACVSVQAIEPVIAPPNQYRSDVAVDVEFLLPGQVGLRCAERGATFLGIPAINSGACADASLVTMLDPCMTLTAGIYAESLCVARSKASPRPERPGRAEPALLHSISLETVVQRGKVRRSRGNAMKLKFVGPELLADSCRQQDLQLSGEPGSQYCVGTDMITLSNPCRAMRPGWYERTLCHELAHVNGWPADHQGGAASYALPRASQSPEAILFATRAGPVRQ